MKKPGMARAEADDGRDHGEERNGVVGPALAENLADQVIGNEIVAPALQVSRVIGLKVDLQWFCSGRRA